jgi:hypothetical protein
VSPRRHTRHESPVVEQSPKDTTNEGWSSNKPLFSARVAWSQLVASLAMVAECFIGKPLAGGSAIVKLPRSYELTPLIICIQEELSFDD